MKKENLYFENKKMGQVGETITWVVATLVIITILLIAIYIVSVGGIVKGLERKGINYEFSTDRIAEISLNSYLLTNQNGEVIYHTLKRDGNLNQNNGPLALKIFKDSYEEDYQEIWFGMTTLDQALIGSSSTYNGRKNDYFGTKPRTIVSAPMGNVYIRDSWFHPRWTKDNEYISLFFVGKQVK